MNHPRYALFSQGWFATVQEVLHADWQEVWHSPHAIFSFSSFRLPVKTVLMCSMGNTPYLL